MSGFEDLSIFLYIPFLLIKENNVSDFNSVEANIPDVKKYVKENPGSAQAVLDAEKARNIDDQRVSLIKHLEEVLASQAPVPEPVDPPAVTVAPTEQGVQNTHSFFGKDYVRTPEGGFRVVNADV